MDNDYSRLNAVDRFINLDAAIAHDLKDIVDLAAQVCETPVALITLLGKETQWFKAGTGVDMTSTPRELALCNHTIKQDELLVVPDTSDDARFSSNPLVASAPFVRFYAGSPLITDDGYAIGTLCVVGFQPKELNELQQKTLKVLSKQVMNLMQLNSSLQNLEVQHKKSIQQNLLIADSELKLKAVFDSSNDLHMLIGKHFEILAFNKSAAGYFHNIYQKAPALGDNILNFIDEDISWQVTRCLLSAMAGRSLKKEMIIRAGTEHASWREIKFMP
ncbi:MAG: GAF domain-containing protein, partial [Mucilaginibacter sp.]